MNETVSIEELEHRMRPRQYSQRGFLGPSESLEEVLARDEQVFANLGISYEQIASGLEKILDKAHEQEKSLCGYPLRDKHPSGVLRNQPYLTVLRLT